MGKIYLFGGGIWTNQGGWEKHLNTLHVYDPQTATWALCEGNTDVFVDTSSFTTVTVIGAFIVLFGGGSVRQQTVANRCYVYDTVSLRIVIVQVAQHWYVVPDGDVHPAARDMCVSMMLGDKVWHFGGYAAGAKAYWDCLMIPRLQFCRPDPLFQTNTSATADT